MKTPIRLILTVLAAFWLTAAVPQTQAVNPPPDGGYPGGNTAEGQNALFSLTTGGFNTAVGYLSLRSDTTGSFNTAIGAGTLLANTSEDNTATGAGALLSNTIGDQNTANGAFALLNNINGDRNTAVGFQALLNHQVGGSNNALGEAALFNDPGGSNNVAVGGQALFGNTIGTDNTAIGHLAGLNQTTGSGNVYIGRGMQGVAGESNTCYIRSIFGQSSPNGLQVVVNSDNKLGTVPSSKRFKEEIKPMDKASEVLFSLKPVGFRYKKPLDPAGTSQFGLVAEEVEKVNPNLVVRDKEGKPYSVRYD
jgi:hypothetical protein